MVVLLIFFLQLSILPSTVVFADGSRYGIIEPFFQGAEVGDEVLITCNSHSKPEWFKDDKKLPSKKHIRDEGEKLHLFEVSEYDKGTYTCSGTDNFGNPFTNKSILSVGAIMNKIKPQATDADTGKDYQLKCESTRKPKWYFGLDWNLPINTMFIHKGKTLNLPAVSQKDSGYYFCYGSTLTKRFWAKAILKVYDNSRISSTTVSVVEGNKIVVGCKSIIPVNWMFKTYHVDHSDVTVIPVSEIVNTMVDRDNYLHINSVGRINQGFYECSGINERQERFFSQLFLIVMVQLPDKVEPDSLSVEVGDDAVFACAAQKNVYWEFQKNDETSLLPQPHRTWQSKNNKHYLMLQSVTLEYSGIYKCLGEDEDEVYFVAEAELIVTEPAPGSKSGTKKNLLKRSQSSSSLQRSKSLSFLTSLTGKKKTIFDSKMI